MRPLSLPFLLPSILLVAPLARGEIVERVVAKVNGQIITLSEFQARQLEAAQAAHVDAAGVGAFLRQHNARILQDAIDEVLILQKAEDADLKPPPQYIEEVLAQVRKEHNLSSQQELEAALAREGLTFGELRRNIESRIQREMIIRRDIEPKLAISDADLRAEYDSLSASEYTTPAKVTLQEIVVTDEAGGEALARQIVAKARAGEDFQALARAHSSAPSRAQGGDVGVISENDMAPALRKVAAALSVGGVSDPVRIEGGYRIIRVAARTPSVTTPFAQVREKIRDRLMTSRFEKEYDAYIQDLRKNAQIELRVREVPLQLTGPIQDSSLLEGIEGDVPGSPAAAAPAASAPVGLGEDEVTMTPQAAPERVVPPTAAQPAPPSPTPAPAGPTPANGEEPPEGPPVP